MLLLHMDYYQKYKNYRAKYFRIKQMGGQKKSSVAGALYGLAVGDALGARYEFLRSEAAIDKIEEDMVDGFLPILGGGPFNISKGQVTDDTEMMISLLNAIAKIKHYDPVIVAKNYIKWFDSNPPDIGRTIKRALCTRKRSQNAKDMMDNAKDLNMTSLSNGLLMRIAPIGVISAINHNINLKHIVKLEGSLTHPHHINVNCAYLYCLAIKMVIEGGNKKDVFFKLLDLAKQTPRLKIILTDAIAGPEPTYMIDDSHNEIYVLTDDKKYQGYLGVALQNTFFEFLHGTSYEKSMIDIIKRGGDTDTNCAIAGGLLGAFYGIEKIDDRWLTTIKKTEVRRYERHPYLSPKMIEKNIDKILQKD